ncbi:hypothetical protein OH76DRAFT_1407841 [Lentinus brumalis]|uniref:Uncharacterized protein n=1 Tax=Lentinus brumalis TaxID=2498619 RepID=A0A371CZG3_9APHY|nr:hypothetical protein OH76DRAFT_1407841 [Polyporus brumalis]
MLNAHPSPAGVSLALLQTLALEYTHRLAMVAHERRHVSDGKLLTQHVGVLGAEQTRRSRRSAQLRMTGQKLRTQRPKPAAAEASIRRVVR